MKNFKIGDIRIIRFDELNYAVERFDEVQKRQKVDGKMVLTGETAPQWRNIGYYSKLEWAFNAAVRASAKDGEFINADHVKFAVKAIEDLRAQSR